VKPSDYYRATGRPHNRDAYLPNLAIAVPNLGRFPRRDRRTRAEALTTSQEAVDYFRELVAANRDAYLFELATAVLNSAASSAMLATTQHALAAAQEAVDYYRELVALNRDAYLPNLAAAVGNLAADTARPATTQTPWPPPRKAVDYFRDWSRSTCDAYLPDLAQSVTNLGALLDDSRPRAEGLAAAQEAVDYYRELVALNRDAYLPDLAEVGHQPRRRPGRDRPRRRPPWPPPRNAVRLLPRTGRPQPREALPADLAQSVTNLGALRRRRQATTQTPWPPPRKPSTTTVNWSPATATPTCPTSAAAVGNLAADLGETGHDADALAAAQEAVDLLPANMASNEPDQLRR
jgi:tetratricopeptide (TPR) repeat protein